MKTLTCPKCKYEFLNPKRSTSQNAYFHAILNTIVNHIGDTNIEQVKEDIMIKLNEIEERPNILTGEMKVYRKSTSGMDTTEFSELTERIRMFAKDFFGLLIPTAEEWKQGIRTEKINQEN